MKIVVAALVCLSGQSNWYKYEHEKNKKANFNLYGAITGGQLYDGHPHRGISDKNYIKVKHKNIFLWMFS